MYTRVGGDLLTGKCVHTRVGGDLLTGKCVHIPVRSGSERKE